MADFCKQCSENMFGPGFNDAKGLISKEEFAKGLAAKFLCEGCGPTLVDPDGNCISGTAGWDCDDPSHCAK